MVIGQTFSCVTLYTEEGVNATDWISLFFYNYAKICEFPAISPIRPARTGRIVQQYTGRDGSSGSFGSEMPESAWTIQAGKARVSSPGSVPFSRRRGTIAVSLFFAYTNVVFSSGPSVLSGRSIPTDLTFFNAERLRRIQLTWHFQCGTPEKDSIDEI